VDRVPAHRARCGAGAGLGDLGHQATLSPVLTS
jgi:hypothetical protein